MKFIEIPEFPENSRNFRNVLGNSGNFIVFLREILYGFWKLPEKTATARLGSELENPSAAGIKGVSTRRNFMFGSLHASL